MVYIAVAVVLIAICSWITIPMTVPFTLQTFAVFCTLLMLGGERGTIAAIVYVITGAVGVPVFSGFNAGLGALLGNTGGYIIGFIFMGLVYMLFTRLFGEHITTKITALIAGLIVCYAFGTVWFMYAYAKSTGPVGLMTVLSWCVFPFIIPDLAKMALAFVISRKVSKRI